MRDKINNLTSPPWNVVTRTAWIRMSLTARDTALRGGQAELMRGEREVLSCEEETLWDQGFSYSKVKGAMLLQDLRLDLGAMAKRWFDTLAKELFFLVCFWYHLKTQSWVYK